jgi:hypothetical protein
MIIGWPTFQSFLARRFAMQHSATGDAANEPPEMGDIFIFGARSRF